MGENNDVDTRSALSGTGERLRAVADRLHGGNKSELARSLGMQPSSFSKYTDGRRRPGAVVLEKLSRLGVNINWLLTGTGAMLASGVGGSSLSIRDEPQERGESRSPPGADSSDPRVHEVPLVRIQEEPDNTLRLIETGQSEWVRDSFIQEEYGVRPALLRDFRIFGDSMADTIRPGNRVRAVLWDCRSPNDGTICIFQSPISLLIRRVRLKDEAVALVADNPDVPDQKIGPEKWETEYEPIARILEVRRAL